MDIQLSADTLKALEKVAEQQRRSVSEVVQEAIESYVASQVRDAQLELDIERIMREHRWLLDELARR